MTSISPKPSVERASVSQSPPATSLPTTTPKTKSFRKSLTSALKKPFQGWSMDLMAAKSHLDDEYNFSDGRRRYHAEYAEEETRKS